VFATDAVIYLWGFNGPQMACELLLGRGAMVQEARASVRWLDVGLFGIFGHELSRKLSEFERTSALRAGARSREGWIGAGGV
jgi:hypothetical protein